MRSKNGIIFGVINVIGNFATVFQDQAVRVKFYS
jgi:urea-proton symporter